MVLEEIDIVDAWKLFTEPLRLPERRSVLARRHQVLNEVPNPPILSSLLRLFAFLCKSKSGVRNTTCAVLFARAGLSFPDNSLAPFYGFA